MIGFLSLCVIYFVLSMGIIDLALTYDYLTKYKKWQPNKPFNMIEMNPLLVFLLNRYGIKAGLLSGGIVILIIQFIIALDAHWVVVALLIIFQIYALFNHNKNLNLLDKLIKKYPTGYLPKETFGEVVGNNTRGKKK